MDPVTVNIIAALLGVIFLTCLAMAIIKIVRSRHDAHNLGNRSVTVPFSDDNAVFDPSSSGLDDETDEAFEPEEITAESTENEDSEPEIATVIAEFAGEPIFSSSQSESDEDIQEIEAIETTEELEHGTEETDDEPTGVIAEGLIEEFLGENDVNSTAEAEAIEENNEDEDEVAAEFAGPEIDKSDLEEVSAETETFDELEAVDEIVNIETDEVDEIEDYFDPDQPAFAARASVPVSTTPLFKVAPPSVPDEEPETIVVNRSDVDDAPAADLAEPDEVVSEEENSAAADEIVADATVPVQQVDIALDPTVPINRLEQPAPDYSFEEVPEIEVIEDEVVLGEEITTQITQLDADLDSIEDLVREIELSLADFEPLSGFEAGDDEKAA